MDINTVYTVIGFYLTVFSTIIGVISLIYAFFISKTANKIKESMMQEHIQKKYKKTKDSILKSLSITYGLAKENDYIDIWVINESLISLRLYDTILSKDTKKKIKKLKKAINKKQSNNPLFNIFQSHNENAKIGFLIYDLIKKLETDFDERNNYLEVITK